MAIPKELKIKLKSILKDGAELPDELDDAVYFPNDGAFMAAVESKTKAKLSAAEAKTAEAQQVAKDREEKLAATLAAIGVDDVNKIEEFKTKWKAAEGSLTEVDALKVELKVKDKEIAKLTTSNVELGGFKVTVLKDKALTPHLAKVHADYRDIVTELLTGKLAVDDKGVVVGPEGKTPESLIEDLIKAKPSFKAPDFKAGTGTGPGGGKTDDKGAGGDKPPPNGVTPHLSFEQQLAADLDKAAATAAQ